MKTKQKLLLCAMLFIFGAIFNLFFTTALHGILSGAANALALPSFGQSLASLFIHKAHLMLFLCLQGIVLLLAVLFFVSNSQPYQSKLKQIAPGIETPVPVGQHQHGSARWLREEEMPRVFDNQVLDFSHPFLQQLLQTGYDDLEFVTSPEQEVFTDDAASEEHSTPNDNNA